MAEGSTINSKASAAPRGAAAAERGDPAVPGAGHGHGDHLRAFGSKDRRIEGSRIGESADRIAGAPLRGTQEPPGFSIQDEHPMAPLSFQLLEKIFFVTFPGWFLEGVCLGYCFSRKLKQMEVTEQARKKSGCSEATQCLFFFILLLFK